MQHPRRKKFRRKNAVADEILNITRGMNDAIRSKRAQRLAVNTVFTAHRARIFESGLDASEQKIGTYSTKPINISPARQARNTGKTHFEGGYAEYKTAIGKNPGYMNLRNFDQMYADYGVIENGDNLGLGFQNIANFEKAMYIQSRQGKVIFQHTQKEINLLIEVLTFELNKI